MQHGFLHARACRPALAATPQLMAGQLNSSVATGPWHKPAAGCCSSHAGVMKNLLLQVAVSARFQSPSLAA
jgi:hypothetical protein